MIPVNEPEITAAEMETVSACLRSGWISSAGTYLDAFEEEWAAYCGRRHGVAVSNGTVALELACAALDFEPGDQVILPTFTIISCALAVIRNSGVPVLVDSDPNTWCMDVDQNASKITPRTRAIMPVHIYGHPVDMDPLLNLAEEWGLAVIEDAAEAHGAAYRSSLSGNGEWRRCGSFGDLSCFSFYANKIVTTGEGGMVLTDDADLAARLRSLRNLGFRRERRFEHRELGYNFRLTNMQAALGVAQLRRIEAILERKRWLARRYLEGLAGIPGLESPVERPWAQNVYWMYGIVVDDGVDMDAAAFAGKLKDRGIETRPFFLGMHEQPVLRGRGLFEGETYPVAERLARRGLYLPSGVTLSGDQVDEVCGAVREILS